MHKYILGHIFGGDESISTNVVEEFNHGALFIRVRFRCRRWPRVGRSLDAKQVLNDITMLISGQGHNELVAGQKTDETKSIEGGPMQEHLGIVNLDETIPLALIVPNQLAFSGVIALSHNINP